MQSIGIVTDSNSRVARFLKDNLKEVLGDFVHINNYYIRELKQEQIIRDQVVLFMIKERALSIKKFISSKSKILIIRRTILENEVYKLFSIPDDNNVLVVNDNDETTLETLSLFYELGINHLNLIPYEEGKIYDNVNVAVTPSESWRVPSYINKIIDLGDRYIDVSTFFQIISALSLHNDEIGRNLIKYSEKIVSLDGGIRDNYKELFIKNIELDIVINLSKNGIALTNTKGVITVCNKSFEDMFALKEHVEGKLVENVFKGELEKIIIEEEIFDEVFVYKNRYINANKRIIHYLGVEMGTYYNLQEITYIKQLEQNLSQKIREKGQVARYTFNDIQTKSKIMNECVDLAKKISKSDLTVLIMGESGTGKELMSQSIHNNSARAKQPFVAVNCAAMPENLLESELFGYERGAFTGALKEGKKGLFEQANNGTIFLDEIGDMPVLLQTKLLRVLQERQVMRIGAQKVIDINVRVIAATNRNLLQMIKEGKFREDLYYRLNVLPINIPSLRERKEDILELLKYFMDKDLNITNEAKQAICKYDWPGNIRELQNAASYISLMCKDEVTVYNLPFNIINDEKKEKNKLNYQEMNEICSEEVYILKSKCDFEKTLEVLNILNAFSIRGESLGRNKLLIILREKNIETKEGEVRKILNVLSSLEFIISKVGRGGSTITEKGKEFLKTGK
ncbi:sigma 54-interacting transcriptional regulator [Clostridium sp. KNHs214]|uniref:sigma 54-interacting transcriptional regulator n=1 Tax=Clostridium sp. KNHs214 TaxID=1540257 RepID=UPI0005567E0E|nr:sigma 54-interacting transcriptional regulator [Clostridium sp. KNHs214]